ncbi:MAG: type II toxin-antitoxin system death-on-curing family toxin [Paludisphaera borealis]|uniref:type II toxin-antitoxin system death-on-curing family toxin n=1 Tax=Paludisphaera borealis TaxID=1387353 RepID=UPI00283CDE48|nr:type II toxin-antitoxin system death-on-curing family toxin [Paludisphaera borealis]MDR3622676.1 type II toxin-antitoxin system death-on-curing family toxin [Paludisphaera borealis]
MNPVFLDVDDVIQIHTIQLEEFGGSEGVRDAGLLDSATAQPAATFGGAFLHADLFEMAAAYLFHIVKNHPFIDGNKRTGLAAAAVFLRLNGLIVDESFNDRLFEMTLAVAEGQMGKSDVAALFAELATDQG